MKSLFAFALILMALPLCAQNTAPAPGGPGGHTPPDPTKLPQGMLDHAPMFSTLSDSDKTKLSTDYTTAMTNNPDLVQEQKDLFEKGRALHHGNGTDADREAFHKAFKDHMDKVRAAIIAADPTIEPVLMRIDQQIAKMKADWEAAHPDAAADGKSHGGWGGWGH